MAELVDTNSATAKASDILDGKTAYVKSGLVAGTIQKKMYSALITPGTLSKTVIERGVYTGGDIVMDGDDSLVPENIAKGVTIFGVKGTWEGEPPPPGLPDGFYTINAKPERESDGKVSGSGIVSQNATITVSAEEEWYSTFENWKENGEIVSREKDYRFNVNSDRNLVATYKTLPVYTISATVDPEGAGSVSGAGKYHETETVNLVATPKNNYYKFSAWKERGISVSELQAYSFACESNRDLVAEFARQLPDGYNALEYIESSVGSDSAVYSHIDIGIKPSSGLGISMDIEPLDYGMIFYSTYMTTSINRRCAFAISFSEAYGLRGAIGLFTSATGTSASITYTTIDSSPTLRRMMIRVADGKVSVDNGAEKSAGNNTFDSSSSAPSIVTPYSIRAKIYSLTVSTSNSEIMKFIPCESPDGVIGMYDVNHDKFYGSNNSQEFIAGPIVK